MNDTAIEIFEEILGQVTRKELETMKEMINKKCDEMDIMEVEIDEYINYCGCGNIMTTEQEKSANCCKECL